MVTFAEIKEKAQQLARDADVAGTIPVPLETIAYYLGYKSLAFDGDKDVDGAIQHESKTIFVNGNTPITRQRFTLAHELGHAVLHKGESIIDYRRNLDCPSPSDRKEVEANKFAADLLMPEAMFTVAWRTRNGDPVRVAKLFGVSSQAASIRAKFLGLS